MILCRSMSQLEFRNSAATPTSTSSLPSAWLGSLGHPSGHVWVKGWPLSWFHMAHSVTRIGMILFLRRFYSIRRLLFNIYLFYDGDLSIISWDVLWQCFLISTHNDNVRFDYTAIGLYSAIHFLHQLHNHNHNWKHQSHVTFSLPIWI